MTLIPFSVLFLIYTSSDLYSCAASASDGESVEATRSFTKVSTRFFCLCGTKTRYQKLIVISSKPIVKTKIGGCGNQSGYFISISRYVIFYPGFALVSQIQNH